MFFESLFREIQVREHTSILIDDELQDGVKLALLTSIYKKEFEIIKADLPLGNYKHLAQEMRNDPEFLADMKKLLSPELVFRFMDNPDNNTLNLNLKISQLPQKALEVFGLIRWARSQIIAFSFLEATISERIITRRRSLDEIFDQ